MVILSYLNFSCRKGIYQIIRFHATVHISVHKYTQKRDIVQDYGRRGQQWKETVLTQTPWAEMYISEKTLKISYIIITYVLWVCFYLSILFIIH